MRLDKKLSEMFSDRSRSQMVKLLEKGCVTVNGTVKTKGKSQVLEDDNIEIQFPEIEERKDLVAEDIPLNIIYECDDYLVINKQKGISVHPAEDEESQSGTIVNAVMYHCGDSLSGIGGERRPGIVHRLDKDTTGILIIAKNDKFHTHLAKQIEERKVKKIYRALVAGQPQDGEINAPIARSFKDRKKMAVRKGGKDALTHFKVLKYIPEYDVSLVEVELVTGRTHQIRVHFASIGHPVVGDRSYGSGIYNKEFAKKEISSQLLHAYSYTFKDLEDKKQTFIAEVQDNLLA